VVPEGEEGCQWLAVGGGWNGNHPYLMSFSYFPGGVLKMAAWHASLLATWSLGFISITFFHPRTRSHPCHSPRPCSHHVRTHLLISVWEFRFSFGGSRLCGAQDPFAFSFLQIYIIIHYSALSRYL